MKSGISKLKTFIANVVMENLNNRVLEKRTGLCKLYFNNEFDFTNLHVIFPQLGKFEAWKCTRNYCSSGMFKIFNQNRFEEQL